MSHIWVFANGGWTYMGLRSVDENQTDDPNSVWGTLFAIRNQGFSQFFIMRAS